MKMNRLSPEELDVLTQPISEIYRFLENEIFRLITKKLKTQGIANVPRWQVERLNELRMVNRETEELLSRVSGVAFPEIRRMIYEVGNRAVADVDTILEPIVGVVTSQRNIDRVLQAFFEQVFLSIENFVNQTLVTTNLGRGMGARVFEQIINQTTALFVTGGITLDQALERTIIDWSRRGIPSILVDRGGNTWSLERYVDMVLRSSLNRTYNELRTSRMQEYGVFTALMTTVPDPHDRCINVQGTVVDIRPTSQAISGFRSIYEFGYGTPQGTLGINCRHALIPFIPGVNVNNEPEIDQEIAQARYKQRERQRVLERRIRQTKTDIMIQEELESPNLLRSQKQLRRQQRELREHIASTGHLGRVPSRERVITPRNLIVN